MVRYERSQFGRLQTLILGGATFLVALTVLASGLKLWGLALVLLMLLFAAEYSRMTVTVDAEAVRVRFRFGLLRRSWPLAQVLAAELSTTPWWYEMGIRLTPEGWLWNVAPGDAVRMTMRDGGRVAIGSGDAAGLLAAIREGAGLR